MDKVVEAIKKDVHEKMNMDRYNQTAVIEDVNCFAHAIGSSVTNNRAYYRLGSISGRKRLGEDYFSNEEVKELFLADTEMLGLDVEELPLRKDKKSIINGVENVKLEENQHIVVLFVQRYADNKIHDFHFIRFDKSIGWTEKRYDQRLSYFYNINISWPTYWMEIIGTFVITR